MIIPKLIAVLLFILPLTSSANDTLRDDHGNNGVTSVMETLQTKFLANEHTERNLFNNLSGNSGFISHNTASQSAVAPGPLFRIECISPGDACQGKKLHYSGDPTLQASMSTATTTNNVQWTDMFPTQPKWKASMHCANNMVVVQIECFTSNGPTHTCEQMKLGCIELSGMTVSYQQETFHTIQSNPISFNREADCDPDEYVTGLKCRGNGSHEHTSCDVLGVYCSPVTDNSSNGNSPDGTGEQDDAPPCSEGGCGGDPHFQTFNGLFFSYHGECDLVLMKSLEMGLEIHIRTTRVNNFKKSFSYISGAALKIGKDVLEVQSDGQIVINNNVLLFDGLVDGKEISGHKLTTRRTGKHKKIVHYELDLGSGKSVKIRFNNKNMMMYVDVNGDFPDSIGLLGSPEKQGVLLGRDGVNDLSEHWNAHGEEWQVNDSDPKLFLENRAPQYPVGCAYEQTSFKTGIRRRLMDNSNVSLELASAACVSDHDQKREFCIADVMATGDLDLASDPFYN